MKVLPHLQILEHKLDEGHGFKLIYAWPLILNASLYSIIVGVLIQYKYIDEY